MLGKYRHRYTNEVYLISKIKNEYFARYQGEIKPNSPFKIDIDNFLKYDTFIKIQDDDK